MRNVQNILIMRGGALGDFVLTLPALAALRKRFPGARLEILGYPRIAELAVAGGLAEKVEPIEAPELAAWFLGNADITDRFAKYDLIVSYLFDPERAFERNVRRSASKALYLRGPHRPDETKRQHAAEQLLEPLKQAGIEGADAIPKLNLAGDVKKNDWLALHPGSGSEKKNWPEDKWAELIAQLSKARRLLLVGGAAEGERLERLQRMDGGARIEMAKNLPLTELAKMLRGCAGFVGHDSGVTHLAAAVGLTGLALWGATNFDVWHPLGGRIKILRHDHGLSQLPVADVLAALKPLLGKMPEVGIV